MLSNKATEALPVVEAITDERYRRAGLALVYQALGRNDEAAEVLQTIIAKDAGLNPYEIAQILAIRGDKKSAVDWLERDYDLKRSGIAFSRKSLAKEPRFIELMKKTGPRQ